MLKLAQTVLKQANWEETPAGIIGEINGEPIIFDPINNMAITMLVFSYILSEGVSIAPGDLTILAVDRQMQTICNDEDIAKLIMKTGIMLSENKKPRMNPRAVIEIVQKGSGLRVESRTNYDFDEDAGKSPNEQAEITKLVAMLMATASVHDKAVNQSVIHVPQ